MSGWAWECNECGTGFSTDATVLCPKCSATLAASRAQVERLEKARDGLCRLMHRTDVSAEARELAADYYRRSSKLSAQPAPCQHGKTQMRENVGYDIDEEGEEDQHLEVCLDCGAERFHCDHTKHGRTVGTWFGGKTAQPAPLGNCSCGKPATVDFADIPMCAECRVKISEAMERRDKNVLRILDNAAQPAPEKPSAPAGGGK